MNNKLKSLFEQLIRRMLVMSWGELDEVKDLEDVYIYDLMALKVVVDAAIEEKKKGFSNEQ
jgi:hypothetical protein